MRQPIHLRTAAVAAIAILALTVAACGSSGNDTTTAASDTATTASATATASGTTTADASAELSAPYSGPESKLPQTYPKPTPKGDFTLGFLTGFGAVPSLAAWQNGAVEATKQLGGNAIVKDAKVNVQTQVTQFQELLDAGVNAIVVQALDPSALKPLLDKAKAAGVPVVGSDVPAQAGQPLLPGFDANVITDSDQKGYALAQAAAQAKPGGSFGQINLSVPSPTLEYSAERTKYWAEHFGLHSIGEVQDAQTSFSEAAAHAPGLLAKEPDVIFGIDDPEALGASTAARTQGKSEIAILGVGGEKAIVPAIESGAVLASWYAPYTELGTQTAWAAYDLATKQHLPLAPQVALPGGELITKENVHSFTPIG